MGVPKFYRWLSERYPCLSEVVKEHQIPEFDNLYLDMNGIIHICSHPNDDDIHFRISEEKIFQDIFHYIEVLFRMIQPRKVFFMAVDGVAPRAKMNQQRGRRFRSAKDAELSEKRAKDRGEELPKEARFDSNCITPGTDFMDRLHQQLKYFVVSKISSDPLWQEVKVILSGHETPGEGEHKIMDFIRYQRSKPDYDSNTRHCLYGLDADLVMLGMCTHDPHFSLLREEVRFGGKKTATKRISTPEETTFHLLHLSLLREYLDHEFSSLREILPFGYDLERIIDDWILLGFLVGNDFLPHLPHLHINKGALTELYEVYKQQLPQLGGHINESGFLNLTRFEKFLTALAEREMDRFDEIYSDNKWLEGKTAKRKPTKNGSKGEKEKFETFITDTPGPASVEHLLSNTQASNSEEWTVVNKKQDKELLKLLQSAEDLFNDDSTSEADEEDPFDTDSDACCQAIDDQNGRDYQYHIEFRQHKREYYIHKLGYDQVTSSVLKEQAEGYVRAIQWNLHYYYNGCKSWSWFYPHHFAPWITDIRGFSNMDLSFELSKPFFPFEQLLSVLPAASKELLPQCLQGLMTSESSPIIDYYPPEFESDLNGKQQDWEAVVLIPFIDEQRLLEAMKPFMECLSPDEKRRNQHGPMQIFTYSQLPLGPYQAPQYFPNIDMNHATVKNVWREEWEVPDGKLRKGLLSTTRLDIFFPGFPTLKHIPHHAHLKQEGVRVFEQQSRGFNMIISIQDQEIPPFDQIVKEYLGKEIWVSWPHMVEAKVISIHSIEKKVSLKTFGGKEIVDEEIFDQSDKIFKITANGIAERYKSRWGVEVGMTRVILHACIMTGRKYICSPHGKITLEKQWSKVPQPFALQATKKDILVHDPSFTQYRTLPELFAPGSACFMLGHPYYGAQGTVLEISPKQKGKITLSFVDSQDPDLSEIISSKNSKSLFYFPGFKAAQKLGITSHLLSRITGSIFVLKGPREAEQEYASKVNIGMNLKNNKKNEEVCGFTRRTEDKNWTYSTKTVEAVNQYMRTFPEIFDFLSSPHEIRNDIFHYSDIFTSRDGQERLAELQAWLKVQSFATAARQSCGAKALDDTVVAEIVTAIDEYKKELRHSVITMHVKPHLLFKPNLSKGGVQPDPCSDFELFDRVVNVRQGFSVPLGLRGTVTGILRGARPEDLMVEVLFDSEFSGGMAIRSPFNRSYRVPSAALINLTYGNLRAKQVPTQKRQPGSYNQPIPVARVKPLKTPVKDRAAPELTRVPQVLTPKDNDTEMNEIQPPDPKLLPKPIGFIGTNKDEMMTHHAEKMEQLWSSLQQPPPSLPQGPSHIPQNSDFLSNHLKSMLNIGSTPVPRGPTPGSSRPPQPFGPPPTHARPTRPFTSGIPPPFVDDFSASRELPKPSEASNLNPTAPAFIPLQVVKKQTAMKGTKQPLRAPPQNLSEATSSSHEGQTQEFKMGGQAQPKTPNTERRSVVSKQGKPKSRIAANFSKS